MPLSDDERGERIHYAWTLLARATQMPYAERTFAREFNCTRRQARRYFRTVKRMWALDGQTKPAERFAETRARIMDLYSTAREGGDLALALRAAERVAELDGLGSAAGKPVLIENNNTTKVLNISNDDAINIIDAIRERNALAIGTGSFEDDE